MIRDKSTGTTRRRFGWAPTWLECGYDLNTRRTISDDGDGLARDVVVLGPVCSMDKVSLEGIQIRNVGPLPVTGALCQYSHRLSVGTVPT